MFAPTPSAKALQTLNQLRNDADFNTFMQDWKWQLVEALIASNDPEQVGRMQGAARAIDEFMKLVQNAPANLARRKP